MGFFHSLRRGKLHPSWHYTVQCVIWRVTPVQSAKLVGEERDAEKKEIRFFCLDQLTGEVLWENRTFDEKWWIGVETVHRDVIFLHHFAAHDLPEHKAIIAVDLLTGKELWSDPELTFVVAEHDSVFASKTSLEGGVLLELDLRSGTLKQSWGSDDRIVLEAKTRVAARTDDSMEFPIPLENLSPDEADLITILRQNLPHETIAGSVEVLEVGSIIAASYHQDVGSQDRVGFDNTLVVLDKRTGATIFNETLNADVHAIVPESFFVQHGMLYFIKNRKTLNALQIPTQIKSE